MPQKAVSFRKMWKKHAQVSFDAEIVSFNTGLVHTFFSTLLVDCLFIFKTRVVSLEEKHTNFYALPAYNLF